MKLNVHATAAGDGTYNATSNTTEVIVNGELLCLLLYAKNNMYFNAMNVAYVTMQWLGRMNMLASASWEMHARDIIVSSNWYALMLVFG